MRRRILQGTKPISRGQTASDLQDSIISFQKGREISFSVIRIQRILLVFRRFLAPAKVTMYNCVCFECICYVFCSAQNEVINYFVLLKHPLVSEIKGRRAFSITNSNKRERPWGCLFSPLPYLSGLRSGRQKQMVRESTGCRIRERRTPLLLW